MTIKNSFCCQLTQGIDPILAHQELTQQTKDVHSMLLSCWTSVADDDPTLPQHWINVSCFLERNIMLSCKQVIP